MNRISRRSPLFSVVPTAVLLLCGLCPLAADDPAQPHVGNSMHLSKWERGIGLHSSESPSSFIYLRFYEWNMFDAVSAGEHTPGRDRWDWDVASDHRTAVLHSDLYHARVTTVDGGARIELKVTNTNSHDWPDIAAIVPCVSPEYAKFGVPQNPFFFDEGHERTWFLGHDGLELLKQREIHFNAELKSSVLQRSQNQSGTFPKFSYKWPTSDKDAARGLMVRESIDRTWVAGVAWSDFLSAQGHNPRKCMHLSVQLGPLRVGESKTIHGRLYLFEGTKQDCVRRFERDFPVR